MSTDNQVCQLDRGEMNPLCCRPTLRCQLPITGCCLLKRRQKAATWPVKVWARQGVLLTLFREQGGFQEALMDYRLGPSRKAAGQCLQVQGKQDELLELRLREGCILQQPPDGLLAEVLIVLMSLHDDVAADLKACRIHHGVQEVGRDAPSCLCPGKCIGEQEHPLAAVHHEQVVGDVGGCQALAGGCHSWGQQGCTLICLEHQAPHLQALQARSEHAKLFSRTWVLQWMTTVLSPEGDQS